MPLILLDLLEEQTDKEAFEAIYYEYRQLLFYVANGILKDSGESEDAVIEAFTRLAKNFGKTNKKICHRTRNYLVIIVKNVALDMLSQTRDTILDDIKTFADINAVNEDPVFSEVDYEELCVAIKNMPDKYSDVLYLSYVEGYSTKSVANTLRLKESTVRKRLERGKMLLRKRYK